MPTYRLRVRLDSTLPGSPAYNIWHIRAADDTALLEPLEGAVRKVYEFYEDLVGIFGSAVSIKVPDDLVKHGDDYAPGVGGTDEGVPFTPATPLIGSGSGLAPAPVAVCVSWGTAIRSRSGRGRTFLGPMSSSTAQSDGSLSEIQRTTVLTASQALVDASELDGELWAIGVYSRKQNVIRDITSRTVRDQWAVLRSRRD